MDDGKSGQLVRVKSKRSVHLGKGIQHIFNIYIYNIYSMQGYFLGGPRGERDFTMVLKNVVHQPRLSVRNTIHDANARKNEGHTLPYLFGTLIPVSEFI